MNSIPELLVKPNHTLVAPSQSSAFVGLTRTADLCIAVLLPLGLLEIVFHDSVAYMVDLWINDENYSHGLLVPLVSLYLAWQKRWLIAENRAPGSWWSIPWILIGMGLYVIGELATVYVLLHLSLWCIIVGLLLSAIGARAVVVITFPLGYLLTAVPLPQFLYQGLSAKLQLISSTLGVGCLQFIGITAFRDGNVIDLGPIQLQVVDACSGLRYLFPLATLALLCSYLFRDRMWKRIVLFVSSIPISILLNGFRIGMIGVLVEYFGQGAADGFYHLFEGWVLFIASLGLLIAEMWVLRNIGSTTAALASVPRSQAPPRAPFPAVRALLRPHTSLAWACWRCFRSQPPSSATAQKSCLRDCRFWTFHEGQELVRRIVPARGAIRRGPPLRRLRTRRLPGTACCACQFIHRVLPLPTQGTIRTFPPNLHSWRWMGDYLYSSYTTGAFPYH